MNITPLVPADQKLIQSYSKGCFKINGEVFACPTLIHGRQANEWHCQDFTDMNDQIRALSGKIDVLLIGAGNFFSVLPPSKRRVFNGLGFVVDVMDTGAACRTYNVLTSEGRLVAAALIPV